MAKKQGNYVRRDMRSIFKYLFVFISLYLLLDFAASNPDKMSSMKNFVDSNIEKAVEYISSIKEDKNVG